MRACRGHACTRARLGDAALDEHPLEVHESHHVDVHPLQIEHEVGHLQHAVHAVMRRARAVMRRARAVQVPCTCRADAVRALSSSSTTAFPRLQDRGRG